MSIPLVQNNEKDSINTSIIAIKRQIERINMLLGLSNSEEIDTSKFATKDELQQAVTDLQPVNEVAADNMQSVTSNGVARALSFSETEQFTGKYWTNGKPIYRAYYKTANFNPSNKIYKIYNVASLNIEECINISGFIYRIFTGYKATYPLNCYETSTMFVLTKYENAYNRISLITQLDDCTDTYAIIFLEYTKTTD